VMLPGRPASWKGHQALLRAASLITDLSFSIVLLGAGDGKPGFLAELEKLAVEVGLGGRVRIAEASRDVPAALMLADVVAMPSVEPEPFGRVAVEAQAMGRPVIAFDMGGAAESILPGETGWLAPPADISGLADALRSALQLGPVQRRKLAARATLNVCDNFTTQKMCRRTIAVYRALLS
jgi:glycosyltransferase involved in cell wall biosynthesis